MLQFCKFSNTSSNSFQTKVYLGKSLMTTATWILAKSTKVMKFKKASSKELVARLKKNISSGNFHIVDLKTTPSTKQKLNLHQKSTTVNWYTGSDTSTQNYQRLQRVVIKGIDHHVDLSDIIADLKLQGFNSKYVHNVLNRHKVPQPRFKVELAPESNKVTKHTEKNTLIRSLTRPA